MLKFMVLVIYLLILTKYILSDIVMLIRPVFWFWLCWLGLVFVFWGGLGMGSLLWQGSFSLQGELLNRSFRIFDKHVVAFVVGSREGTPPGAFCLQTSRTFWPCPPNPTLEATATASEARYMSWRAFTYWVTSAIPIGGCASASDR